MFELCTAKISESCSSIFDRSLMKSEENKNPDKFDYGKSKEGPYGCLGFYPEKLQCFNAVGSWDLTLSHNKPIFLSYFFRDKKNSEEKIMIMLIRNVFPDPLLVFTLY